MKNKIGLRCCTPRLMHLTKIIFVGFLGWVIMVTSGAVQLVFAEELYYAKPGLYLGLSLPYNTIEGDFDGETVLTGPSDIILVPSIEGGYGFGISLGVRSGPVAGEINYQRTTHDASFQGLEGDVVYNTVNLDGKFHFLAHERAQPYLLLGLSFPWLTITDGSVTVPPSSVGDATFTGIGLNFGTGIAYYLNPRVSINAGINYRLVWYTYAEGVVGKGDLEDALMGDGINLNVGISYSFLTF